LFSVGENNNGSLAQDSSSTGEPYTVKAVRTVLRGDFPTQRSDT